MYERFIATRRRAYIGASLLGLTIASPALHAEDSPLPERLDTVQVVGTSPLPGANVPKDQVPSNVQTATNADLERTNAPDLTNYLNRRLGSVFINEVQNNPFQPDVNFRGYTASPLLGTQQGLSIYQDGVRLNQPFGDVVSWDLIPKSAIASIALMPGSNPVFGLNTLGGALSIETKDGLKNPGSAVEGMVGSYGRVGALFETGGSSAQGWNWFVTGNRIREDGWRDDSKSQINQLFGKVGYRTGDTDIRLTGAVANTDLNGNGLQEQRFLERAYGSVYTKPDNTKNRSMLFNLAIDKTLSDAWSLSGNAYYRKIKTATSSGDINDDSFDQSLYQPNAAEQAALTAAGYSGFPTSGENASNTPFPKWRCIANALRQDEPGEKCDGVTNQTSTDQSNYGIAAQLNYDGSLFGFKHQSLIGAALDLSRSRFLQGSELGYLNPDRSVTGVGAFGDGVSGGNVDGVPYDTRADLYGRTRTASLYAGSVVALNDRTHLSFSARYNQQTVKNRDAIVPAGTPGSLDGDQRFSRFNPSIGLTVIPVESVTVYANVNQGSRSPSSVELGCADPANPCKLPNAFAGDPPLKQVVTTTYEAGLRGAVAQRVVWNAGVFRSDNRDDLLFVSDNAAGFGYFRNFGRTRRQGIELGTTAQLNRVVTVGANYTLLDATFCSSETVDGSANSSNDSAQNGLPGVAGTIEISPGDRIPLVPRQIFKTFVDLQVGAGWSMGADLLAIGRSVARGNENGQHQPDGVYYLGSGYSPGYAVLNLDVAYRPTKALKLFAQLNNALDRRYSTAAQLGSTGFNNAGNIQGRPFPANVDGDRPIRSATFYAPGAPQTLWVGLRYTLD